MIHALLDIFVFAIDVIVLAIAILFVFASIISMSAKSKGKTKSKIIVTDLNKYYQNLRETLLENELNKKQKKDLKKQNKKDKKKAKPEKTIYVLDFQGDIKASAAEPLRHEVSAILSVAGKKDEVFVRLESPGGVVHGYGLAASQLQRIKDHGIPLTISVDKVAASGGYMMACIANKILSAPFAIIGSIGVIAQIPNFNKLLKKHDIDFEQITAGEYKRTLTMFAENTDKAREKMQQDISEVHDLFKQHVIDHRPQVDMQEVGTGEYWFGTRALELKLVDTIQTSDDYLMRARKKTKLRLIKKHEKKKFMHKLGNAAELAFHKLFTKNISELG